MWASCPVAKLADVMACTWLRQHMHGWDDLTAQDASVENACQLDCLLVRITDVFLPDSENRCIRMPFHPNHGYAYVEIAETNLDQLNKFNM